MALFLPAHRGLFHEVLDRGAQAAAAKTFNRLPFPEVLSFTSLSIWGYRERSALSLDYGRGDRSAYKKYYCRSLCEVALFQNCARL